MREKLGLLENRNALAEKLGLVPDTLGSYERGIAAPPPEVLARYHTEFGVNISWLVSGMGEVFSEPSKLPSAPIQIDQKTIQKLVESVEEVREATARPTHRPPRSEPRPPKTMKYFPNLHVSAGAGRAALYESPGVDLDAEAFATRVLSLRADTIFLFPITGDSMFPSYCDGDIAIADSSDVAMIEGEVYVVNIDGDLRVKRIRWDIDVLVLASDNQQYDPIFLPGPEMNRAIILGKVSWVLSRAE